LETILQVYLTLPGARDGFEYWVHGLQELGRIIASSLRPEGIWKRNTFGSGRKKTCRTPELFERKRGNLF